MLNLKRFKSNDKRNFLLVILGDVNERFLLYYNFITYIKLVKPINSLLNKKSLKILKMFLFRAFQTDSNNNSVALSNIEFLSVKGTAVPFWQYITKSLILSNHEVIVQNESNKHEAEFLNTTTGNIIKFNYLKYKSGIKVLRNYIFTWISPKIQIYDLDFNNLSTITIPDNPINYLVEGSNDIVFIQTYKILFFDMNTFSIIGYIKDPAIMLSFNNENIAFSNGDTRKTEKELWFNFKIKMRNSLTESNFEKFCCKMNPFKIHLYSNPYFLPCGNSACLECIYKCFNLYRRSIKCKFLTCKEEHYLSHRFEDDLVSNRIIEENIHEIIVIILLNGNASIISRGKY